jgi:tRNA dimethylallyltransferase
MRSVGYRQSLEYLKGDVEKKDCIYKIIFATRQLAKRQMTWMRSMEDLNLFDCISDNLSNEVIAFVKNKIV